MPDSPRLHRAKAGRFVTFQFMPSLNQLLAAHAPLLVLDAASTHIQVGWLEPDSARWATSPAEAGIGLFGCLEELQVRPEAAGAFVFCDGPGSILGVRTVAMMLRAWLVLRPRPVFAYHSLLVVAHARRDPALTVIADARRDSWHCAALGAPLRRVPASELPARLAMPEGFRTWSTAPVGVERVPYSLAELLGATADAELFRPTDAPDAFLHEEPSYATWSPQIHRAP